jgi:hypothetical protein
MQQQMRLHVTTLKSCWFRSELIADRMTPSWFCVNFLKRKLIVVSLGRAYCEVTFLCMQIHKTQPDSNPIGGETNSNEWQEFEIECPEFD